MKINYAFFTIVFICCLTNVKGQSDTIHNDWVKADSVFINAVADKYKSNPLQIDQILFSDYTKYSADVAQELKKKTKLGFGYDYLEASSGKGYVSIFYKFIYLKNKLVSYELEPQMPNDVRLKERYLKFYAQLFKVDKDKQPELIYYGYHFSCEPVGNYNDLSSTDSEIQFYMTPFSGIVYGDYGGIANEMLENRAVYTKIKKRITPKICELLLYSSNPATRLTGIEYFYQHPKLFEKRKINIEKRIRIIYDELPVVLTMSADLEFPEDAKKLVEKFSKEKL